MTLTRSERMIIFITMLFFFLIVNHLFVALIGSFVRPRLHHKKSANPTGPPTLPSRPFF